jgi:hypothetical protein
VGEEGEEGCCREGREESWVFVPARGFPEREEEDEGGAEELGEVDKEVLVMGMEAVEGEISGVKVVEEVVDGSNGGVLKQVGECEGSWAVEGCVGCDGKGGEKSGREEQEDERKRPGGSC